MLLSALLALLSPCAAGVGEPPGRCTGGEASPIVAVFPPSDTKLGLAFYRPLVPPTLSRVAPGSLAASTTPSLRPGLQLWAVNGQSVGGLSFRQALDLLRDAPRPMELQFGPPPARSATGDWLDHGEVAVAGAAGDDAALTAALHRLSEDDAYELLAYLAPRATAVAARLRRLVQVEHSWAEPRLQREAAVALTLVGDYFMAHTVLGAIVDLPHADHLDAWRQPMLIGTLQCLQGLQASCMRSLRKAVQLADSHGADAAYARAALAEQLLQRSVSSSKSSDKPFAAEAVQLYRQSVSYRPHDVKLRVALAIALVRAGEANAAKQEYNQLLTLSDIDVGGADCSSASSSERGDSLQAAVAVQAARQRRALLALRDQGGLWTSSVKILPPTPSLSEETNNSVRRREVDCAEVDCPVLTHGRSSTCDSGYCLCRSPFYGLHCQHTLAGDRMRDALKNPGGELSSEYDYLLSAGFQLKQRIAAALVAQGAVSGNRLDPEARHFVLEVGGGYKSGVAPYLSSRPSLLTTDVSISDAQRQPMRVHHNVEPVARAGRRQFSNGWRSVNLPLGFEDYDYRLQLPNSPDATFTASTTTLVMLGFTPTKRSYCHSVLSSLRAGIFDRVVLEAPAVGDLLGMSALASSMLELQRAGYGIVTAKRLDPCEGWDPLGTVTVATGPVGPNGNQIDGHAVEGGRRRRGTRLPPDLHPPDCERFIYALDRRHHGYSYADWIRSPFTSLDSGRYSGSTASRSHNGDRDDEDATSSGIETARAQLEAQMTGPEILARAQDGVAFVQFFRGLLARVSSFTGASSAAAICAPGPEASDLASASSQSVVEHIASLLADSVSLQAPFTGLALTAGQRMEMQVNMSEYNRGHHAGPLVGHHLLGMVAQTVGDDRVGIRDDSRLAVQVTIEMKVERERVSVTISDPHRQHGAERGEQTSGLRSNAGLGSSAAQMVTEALGAAPIEEVSLLFFDSGVGDYRKCEEAIAEFYELLLVKQTAQDEGQTSDEKTMNAFGDMAVTRVVLEAAKVIRHRNRARGEQEMAEGAIAFRSALQLLPDVGFVLEAAAWVEDLDCSGAPQRALHGGGSAVAPEHEAAIGEARERARRERCYRYVVVMQRPRSRTGQVDETNEKKTKEWIQRYKAQLARLRLPTNTCLSQRDTNSE